jgi:hypothetical protein
MTTLIQPLFRLQSREYKLFISHAWDYSDDCDGVVRLLNEEYGFKWIDLSVPKRNRWQPIRH